jgi:5-methylcytosine-specific restriction endonuclease McrA
VKTDGRSGRSWRKVRAEVLAASDVCHICGHPGATVVDHEPPLVRLRAMGLNGNDRRFLRPAHRTCNARKGAHTLAEHRNGGLTW